MSDRSPTKAALAGALRWYVRRRVAGEDEIRRRLEKVSDADQDIEARADELERRESYRAALRGLLTGAAASPWTALPLALINIEGASAQQMRLAAALALLRDPEFFERRDWELDVLRSVAGSEVANLRAAALAKAVAKRYAVKQAKKAGVRVATNFVPILGGVAGATIEYVLLRQAASAIRSRVADLEAELDDAPLAGPDLAA